MYRSDLKCRIECLVQDSSRNNEQFISERTGVEN